MVSLQYGFGLFHNLYSGTTIVVDATYELTGQLVGGVGEGITRELEIEIQIE